VTFTREQIAVICGDLDSKSFFQSVVDAIIMRIQASAAKAEAYQPQGLHEVLRSSVEGLPDEERRIELIAGTSFAT